MRPFRGLHRAVSGWIAFRNSPHLAATDSVLASNSLFHAVQRRGAAMSDVSNESSVAERRDLAMREVLGLLDSDEEARLGRMFDALSPQDQAELLDLQAAIASQIGGLGDELPDRALRYQVLARLAEEIDQENIDVSPIASIGTRRLGRTGQLSSDVRGLRANGGNIESDRVTRDRTIRSAHVWRAATIAFAAAFLAVLVFQQSTQDSLDRILAMLDGASNQEQLRKDMTDRGRMELASGPSRALVPALESPNFDRFALLCPRTEVVGAIVFAEFSKDAESDDTRARRHTLFVFGNDAPTREFDLVGIGDGGVATVLGAKIPNLQLASIDFENDELASFASIELRDSLTNETVFKFTRRA